MYTEKHKRVGVHKAYNNYTWYIGTVTVEAGGWVSWCKTVCDHWV